MPEKRKRATTADDTRVETDVVFDSFSDVKRGTWTKVSVLVPQREAGAVKHALMLHLRDRTGRVYLVVEQQKGLDS